MDFKDLDFRLPNRREVSAQRLCYLEFQARSCQELYVKVGAKSTGPIPIGQLVGVVEKAAKTGAKVVMDAVNKPRNITSKGLMDLVTEEELNRHAFTSVFSMLQLTCSDNTF